jgi:hypothetical protein
MRMLPGRGLASRPGNRGNGHQYINFVFDGWEPSVIKTPKGEKAFA